MSAPRKLSFQCVACKRKLAVPASAAGKVVACPCGQKLKVPNVRTQSERPQNAQLPNAAPEPSSMFDTDFPSAPTNYQPPPNPYQSSAATTGATRAARPKSDVNTVVSGQKILIYSIIGYLCALPLLVLANVFLEGTPEKPVVTPAFGLVLATGLLGMFSAGCVASFGILRMGGVLFPGSTQTIYALGALIPAPLIGLLVMIVANTKATQYLKAKGLKVGFFGAKV